MNNFRNVIDEIVKGFQDVGNRFREILETVDWSKISEFIQNFHDELPKKVGKLSGKLANKGWFIWLNDVGLSFVFDTLEQIDKKEDHLIDQHLTVFFEENLKNIENEIIFNYPNRIHQIRDAFSSHKHKLFYSSTPSFLILAEGICRDMYPKIGLYAKHPPKIKKNNGKFQKNPKAWKPKTIDILDEEPCLEIFEQAVLKPLKIKSNITKTINNPSLSQKQLLNRHLIIHGISESYGSSLNSLKAISLVFYVHKSLSYLKEKSR